jgi:hypothetical protein
MTNEERIKRLEDTLCHLISTFQDFHRDYTWQAWNDKLKEFQIAIDCQRIMDGITDE